MDCREHQWNQRDYSKEEALAVVQMGVEGGRAEVKAVMRGG